jgi:RND family efflux transporter MFP subunit
MAALLSLCLFAGCTEKPTESSGDNDDKKEQAAPIKLPAVVATTENVPRTLTIPGVVSALPDHSVKVSPAISGKLLRVLVVPGQKVSAGQLIAELDDRHVVEQLEQSTAAIQSAQANIAQAQENLNFARDNLDRQKHLYQAEVGAGKDVVLAENQVKTSQSQLNAAQAQLKSTQAAKKQIETELQYTKVHAPIAGVVSNRYLNVGDTTDPNTAIIQVVDLKKVVINAGLPADVPDRLRVGDHAAIHDLAHPETTYDGILTTVSPEVDPQSDTIRVQLQSANVDGELREGLTVNVVITSKIDQSAIVVPEGALVPDPDHPDQDMVCIVSDGKAKRVPVVKGALLAGRVEIVSGLRAGELVITSGAYGLPDDTRVDPQMK